MKKKISVVSFYLLSVSILAAQPIQIGPKVHKSTSAVNKYDLPVSRSVDFFSDEEIPISFLNKSILSASNSSENKNTQQTISKQSTIFNKTIDGAFNYTDSVRYSAPKQRASTALSPSFTESFESYNGADLNWIPDNWTEKNKTGNIFNNDGTSNPTWYVTGSGDQKPTDGKYMAWVNFADGKDQDEWLISNSFTMAKEEEFLYFDANYASYFMYFDYNAFLQTGQINFDFTKPTATLQAYVSMDNGENWELVWDAHEDAALYNINNINDYKFAKWHSVKKSLIKYSGKTVKIAFRYVGRDGDSMGLDNIKIRSLSPNAFYQRPQGYFYLGYTQDFNRSVVDFTYGPPFEDALWINKSGPEAVSFNWTFPDPKIDNKTFTTSVKNPKVNYPNGIFKMPLLKASVGFTDSTYIWGTSLNGSYFLLGGKPDFGWGTIGICNYDRSKGIAPYRFGVNDFVFGTDSTNRLFSVANYFEKPVKKYILENIWINFGTFEAPAETEFKMIIHKFKTNETGQFVFGDTIASCSALAQDVTNPVTGFYSLNFNGFSKFDPELGLDVTKDYLEIEDAILIEFTGFSNNPDIKLSVFSQRLNTSGNENNAYVIYNNNGVRTVLPSTRYISNPTSLLINLGATYSYLQVDNNLVHLSAQASTETIVVNSNYTPDDWWLNSALPDWLSVEYEYNTKKEEGSVLFTAQALPDGVSEREAVLQLGTYGSNLSLNIKQDRLTGISDINAADVSVICHQNSFDLNYSNDFKSLAIFNLSGQIVGIYQLPTNGKYTISSSQLLNGVYILKFTGKTNKQIKIVR